MTAAALMGNLAVLVGLAFVVVELRQNRQNLDATVELGVSAAYQDITSRAIENPQFAEVILKTFTAPDSLTGAEFVQVINWMAEWSAVLFASWELRNRGITSEDAWLRHGRSFVLFFEASPWFEETYFSQTEGSYPDAFLNELRSLRDANVVN